MTSALLIVPPFVSVASGPLLGPAMLVAAGRSAGHDVAVLDLNEYWIREHAVTHLVEPRRFLGDHDRPETLAGLRRRFTTELGTARDARTHAGIRTCAFEIARGPFGRWITALLGDTLRRVQPEVVGVSVMYDDQVAPALAITGIVRHRLPGATIVWGGPHVTAMREEIARDQAYDGGLIDGFVFGYAEATWAELLTRIRRGNWSLLPEVVSAGSRQLVMAREDLGIIPDFGELQAFEPTRLTLPMQASRGCSYGTCAFCTYPAVEGGGPRRCSVHAVQAVIDRAISLGASVSFKDSLVDHDLLLDLAARFGGRASWSACTKLDARLPGLVATLARGGCHTLEIGLETIDPRAQKDALKKQRVDVFVRLLSAAEVAGVAIVINYMTGFPNAEREREEACKRRVQDQLDARSQLVSKLEHHELQVERLAPFGRNPAAHGIEIIGERPWASVLDWRPAPERLVQVRRSFSTKWQVQP